MDWVLLGVLLVLSLGSMYLVTGGDLMFLGIGGGPPSCLNEPFNHKCVCPVDLVKVALGWDEYACVEAPTPPEGGWVLPLESWEEVWGFATDQFGVEDLGCTGVYFIRDGALNGEIYKQCGGYGSLGKDNNQIMGWWLRLSCDKTDSWDPVTNLPKSGYTVWLLDFDPNSGFVYERWCLPGETPFSCPANTKVGLGAQGFFDSVCGDSADGVIPVKDHCCTYGESFESCPEDCSEPLVSQDCCGDGTCDLNRVDYVKCPIGGVYTTTWTSDCNGIVHIRDVSECDGYDVIVDGVRQVTSVGRRIYEKETVENCPVDCS